MALIIKKYLRKKMSRNDQYFPHDYNAFSDLKIRAFFSDAGMIGYGFYWVVIEQLHKEDCCQLPKVDKTYKALAQLMSTSVEQIKTLVEQATDNDLFIKNDEFIISERVLKNMNKRQEISDKRSVAGKISALKRTSVEQVLTSVEQNSTKESKEKEIKGNKKERVKKITPARPELPDYQTLKELYIKTAKEIFKTDKVTLNELKCNDNAIEFCNYFLGDVEYPGVWFTNKKYKCHRIDPLATIKKSINIVRNDERFNYNYMAEYSIPYSDKQREPEKQLTPEESAALIQRAKDEIKARMNQGYSEPTQPVNKKEATEGLINFCDNFGR
jgi:hypothetical protein